MHEFVHEQVECLLDRSGLLRIDDPRGRLLGVENRG